MDKKDGVEADGTFSHVTTPATQATASAESLAEPVGEVHKARRWHRMLVISMGFALVLTSGVIFQTLSRHKAPTTSSMPSNDDLLKMRSNADLPRVDTIVLSEFTNSTGDGAFDGLNPFGNVDYNVAPLEPPSLKFVSPGEVNEFLYRMNHKPEELLTPDLARQVCLMANARAVVTGSISADGAHYRITATAISCQTGQTLAKAERDVIKRAGRSTEAKRVYVSLAMTDVVDELLQKLRNRSPS